MIFDKYQVLLNKNHLLVICQIRYKNQKINYIVPKYIYDLFSEELNETSIFDISSMSFNDFESMDDGNTFKLGDHIYSQLKDFNYNNVETRFLTYFNIAFFKWLDKYEGHFDEQQLFYLNSMQYLTTDFIQFILAR